MTEVYLLRQFKLDLSRNDFFQIEKKEINLPKKITDSPSNCTSVNLTRIVGKIKLP